MINRSMKQTVLELAEGFPIVAITGPRQSGKTTLSQLVFSDKPYVSLELPQDLQWAQDDPIGFLDRFPDGVILDEIQLCPELFSHLQVRVDQARIMGQYIITGSQQFALNAKIAQSLAGRVASVSLLPFSLNELNQGPTGQFFTHEPGQLDLLLWKGFYPSIYDRQINPLTWHSNYLRTYLERDLRQLQMVEDLSVFQRFMRLCAGRTGQLLNISSLASDCGMSAPTIRRWLSVLEASYVIKLVQPYYRNFRKRLVKSPKLFFLDTGLAAYLIGIENAGQIATHPLRGALFETFVFGELLKSRMNRGHENNLHFWRDNHGLEVDFLFEQGQNLVFVEAKSSATVTGPSFKGLKKLRSLAENEKSQSWLVYGGTDSGIRGGNELIPWFLLGKKIEEL